MSFLKENKFFIILIYINILFVVTITKEAYKIENFNYIFLSLLYFAGIGFYWFGSTVLKKKSLKIIFLFLIIGGAFLYCYFNFDSVMNTFQIQIVDNFNNINNLVAKSLPTDFENYKPIFITVIPILSFIIMFLTSKGLSNSVLILNLVLIITLWYLGYTEEIKEYLFYYVLISLITYSINNFVVNTKKLNKKGIKVGIASYKVFIYSIILSIIIALISSVLPQDFSGRYSSQIQGKFYNKFVKSSETGEEKGKKFKYDLSFSGYDNNKKKLGGPVVLNKLVAFKVESDKAYYLKGTVKEFYDGFSWAQGEKTYSFKKSEDSSLIKDKYNLPYTGKTQSLKILPIELNSSTIFIPNLAYNAYTEKGYIYYDDIPTFISSEVLANPYTVDFYSLNDRGMQIINESSNKKLQEVGTFYYSDIYKKYLQVPENLSTRIYDLVYSLTNDKKNNFEKVQAIRNYLNKTYPYTLKVSSIPDGQEFLDYFLFTEKKGYCTYFATAQTIMCRIAGIPARYVEGFNMSEEIDAEGRYVVRNENAHAWTEVLYMENELQGLWYTVDAVPNAVETVHKEEEEEKKPDININAPSDEQGVNINSTKRPNNRDGEDIEQESSKITIPPGLLKLMYTLSIFILLNIVLIIIFAIRKKIMLNEESAISIYKYSLERLETVGYISSEFTPDIHMINKMDEELSLRVKEAATLAYREYYGGKNPESFNKKEYYDYIETYIKNRQSKLEYFIKKYYFVRKVSLLKEKLVLLYRKIKSI